MTNSYQFSQPYYSNMPVPQNYIQYPNMMNQSYLPAQQYSSYSPIMTTNQMMQPAQANYSQFSFGGCAQPTTTQYQQNNAAQYQQNSSSMINNMMMMMLNLMTMMLTILMQMFRPTGNTQTGNNTGNANTGNTNTGNTNTGNTGNTNTGGTVIDGGNGDDVIIVVGDDEVEPPVPPAPPEAPEPVIEQDASTSRAWGDPHFELTIGDHKQQSFDLQGKGNTVYNMLDSDEFSLNAKFSNGAEQHSRLITDQNLTLKGTDINVVSHGDGKYEIYYKGSQIQADDPKLAELGINIKKEDNALTVSYKDRTVTQKLNGSHIEDIADVKTGDKGLLNQLIGAIDDDGNKSDNIVHATFDVNKDGKVDDNDVIEYDSDNQIMVNSRVSAISAAVITDPAQKVDDLAKNFTEQAGSNDSYIDEAFEGAFEGSGSITSADDAKLAVLSTDSESVKLAKEAMKANLIYKSDKSETAKQTAIEANQKWIENSSKALVDDVNNGTASIANRYVEGNGYSRSQWNEYMGSKFVRDDNYLVQE